MASLQRMLLRGNLTQLIAHAGQKNRTFLTASTPLRSAAASAAAPTKASDSEAVNPDDPIIAPTIVHGREYKNEHYLKRGYKMAPKTWTEWEDLPAPYKYLGVKVNPQHVENTGFLWKAFGDWKLFVPAGLLVMMPLWMTGNLPSFDERLELGLITLLAGTMLLKEATPMIKKFKTAQVIAKNKALYELEAKLNSEIARAIAVYEAGESVPEARRIYNKGERALKALEAKAATTKLHISNRETMIAQLEYLASLKTSALGDAQGAMLRLARHNVEAAFEKDSSLQQRSIEGAIKALKEGTINAAEDLVEPTFAAALKQAEAEVKAKPAVNPFKQAQSAEIFHKRFGFGADNTRTITGGAKLKSPLEYLK